MTSEGRAISIQRHDRVNIQRWPDAGKIHTDSARETNKLRHYRNRGINPLATNKSCSAPVYPVATGFTPGVEATGASAPDTTKATVHRCKPPSTGFQSED